MRELFDSVEPLTVGLEEEVMLLDPVTFDLAPIGTRIPSAKLELPAAQVELDTPPAATVGEAIAALAEGRRELAAACGDLARPAVAAVHPFTAPLGELNAGERYDAILARYGDVARTQLVSALQVHVAIGSAERSLEVYNALRSHLPELAALAANAPFLAGRDTGFASVRPLIGGLLPRQNVPPAFASWDEYEEALRWVKDPGSWWWELRPHPKFGTLEIRVCDAQTTLEEAAAVAAYAHALVGWLAERDDLETVTSWKIAENRWAALRHGVEATFTDLRTGEERPVRDILLERVETLAPVAERLGCADELALAPRLVVRNGALRQREVGVEGAASWLAERFLTPVRSPARPALGTG
ncbi:YbdK family carboxylate-amine ligase [Solirubrobacter sp. CPCC 204708]|uniref:Putative glutamate--cysteine ligase 2 n=1 Tax=Solirubrobacter deserti TaxID=2282478 RepID=A0ABT4REF9_9ACTN|nr:YbdK family carboxylate-amine ligase [Solirubrobacter deserti]MBE2315994.1 YbdK family carboxylate-amine ligase [Solirubrobacter deserti]MDA0136746.1 YbdK family carboxylate-amine ligase [Solirubrobacter deserti]